MYTIENYSVTDPDAKTSLQYSDEYALHLSQVDNASQQETNALLTYQDAGNNAPDNKSLLETLIHNAKTYGHFGIRYPYPFGRMDLAQEVIDGVTGNISIKDVVETGIKFRESGFHKLGDSYFYQALGWIDQALSDGKITQLDAIRMKPIIEGHLAISKALQGKTGQSLEHANGSTGLSVLGAGINTLPEGLRHFTRVGFSTEQDPSEIIKRAILAKNLAVFLNRADATWYWNGVFNTLYEADANGVKINPRRLFPYVLTPLVRTFTRTNELKNWRLSAIRNAGQFIRVLARK